MIIKEEDYLEHFGKRGMKWGERHQSNKEHAGTRSRKQKVLIVGAGLTGYSLGRRVTAKLIRNNGKKPLRMIAGVSVGTALGVHIARNFIDKHNDKKISEIRSLHEST